MSKIANLCKNDIILSPDDVLYLNEGNANQFGADFASWHGFETLYKYNPYPEGIDKSRILGSEICLWGETNDSFSLERYLFMRAAFAAKKLWSSE